MEAAESNLETKLSQLHMNVKKTDLIIDGDNSEAIETSTNSKDNLGHCQPLKTCC